MPQPPTPTPTTTPTPPVSVAAPQQPFLDVLLSNPLHAWIIAGATLLGLIIIFYLLRLLIVQNLGRLAARTKTRWDDVLVDVLRGVRFWLIFPALVHAAAQALSLPHALERTIQIIAIVGVGIQLLVSSLRLVDAGIEAMVRRARTDNGQPDPTVASSMGVLRVMALGVIGLLIVLLALDNLGVSITPMLTGLGIGGIAVALAVQSMLGDLFGSLTILLDKPFVVGDFIVVGDKMGTVERIGVKTTRVRALSGEQLVFANSDLLSSRVQNFKRMQERRVVFAVSVTYETPTERVRALPGIIRAAIEKQKPVRFDRSHFKGFGAYSLDYEAVYYVLSAEYNVFMDVQQAINIELLERFAAEGIEFAYPTSMSIRREAPPAPTSPGVPITPATSAGSTSATSSPPPEKP